MELYLVQHGEATSETENPDRPLTIRGRDDVQRVSRCIAPLGLAPVEIRHSGKTRAQQTAQLIAEALSCPDRVKAASGLAPTDDVRPIAREVEAAQRPLMLVGHLPFMSRLASLLLVADSSQTIVRFRTGGVVCLGREERGWTLNWMITPDTVP